MSGPRRATGRLNDYGDFYDDRLLREQEDNGFVVSLYR